MRLIKKEYYEFIPNPVDKIYILTLCTEEKIVAYKHNGRFFVQHHEHGVLIVRPQAITSVVLVTDLDKLEPRHKNQILNEGETMINVLKMIR